jgi:hypothetical protein
MDDSAESSSVIHESLWRMWAHKGKLRAEASARRAKVLAGFVFVILVVALGVFVFATR